MKFLAGIWGISIYSNIRHSFSFLKQVLFHWEVHVCLAMSDSLQTPGLEPTRLLCPWSSPGNSPGMGCHFLFQGIFPTQGLNPDLLSLLHCRQLLYHRTTGKVPFIEKVHAFIWKSPFSFMLRAQKIFHFLF